MNENKEKLNKYMSKINNAFDSLKPLVDILWIFIISLMALMSWTVGLYILYTNTNISEDESNAFNLFSFLMGISLSLKMIFQLYYLTIRRYV